MFVAPAANRASFHSPEKPSSRSPASHSSGIFRCFPCRPASLGLCQELPVRPVSRDTRSLMHCWRPCITGGLSCKEEMEMYAEGDSYKIQDRRGKEG